MVGRLTLAGAWPLVPRLAGITNALQAARRRQATFYIAGALLYFEHIGWDINQYPVPETTAGRGVHIVHGYGKAFGAGRGVLPVQLRRFVRAITAEIPGNKFIGELAA